MSRTGLNLGSPKTATGSADRLPPEKPESMPYIWVSGPGQVYSSCYLGPAAKGVPRKGLAIRGNRKIFPLKSVSRGLKRKGTLGMGGFENLPLQRTLFRSGASIRRSFLGARHLNAEQFLSSFQKLPIARHTDERKSGPSASEPNSNESENILKLFCCNFYPC